eukprot:scaffold150011_cov30-Tisochrysis_lutea.AAC.3
MFPSSISTPCTIPRHEVVGEGGVARWTWREEAGRRTGAPPCTQSAGRASGLVGGARNTLLHLSEP